MTSGNFAFNPGAAPIFSALRYEKPRHPWFALRLGSFWVRSESASDFRTDTFPGHGPGSGHCESVAYSDRSFVQTPGPGLEHGQLPPEILAFALVHEYGHLQLKHVSAFGFDIKS